VPFHGPSKPKYIDVKNRAAKLRLRERCENCELSVIRSCGHIHYTLQYTCATLISIYEFMVARCEKNLFEMRVVVTGRKYTVRINDEKFVRSS
jgi:hypothetical protein